MPLKHVNLLLYYVTDFEGEEWNNDVENHDLDVCVEHSLWVFVNDF